MFSRLQPALPGASHGLRGSCTAGPPHLALPWTPVATLQAFGQGDAYVNTQYFLWRKTVEDVTPVTSDRRNSRWDQPCARHQNTHTTHIHTSHTQTHTHHQHCLTCSYVHTCSGEVTHCRAASELHPCMTGGGSESSAHKIQSSNFIQGHST